MFSPTPTQPEGPFYPTFRREDEDWDLTSLKGSSKTAEGEVVIVKGVVTDQNCLPLEGVIVEIWQASHGGKYLHERDTSNGKLDPHFQYWGVNKTNNKGEYFFKTIIPGSYQASQTWIRPPHIHFKVSKRGYRELITQMYFAGNEFNDHDLILQDLSHAEQSSVIVEFEKDKTSGLLTGEFPLSLSSLRMPRS